MENSLASAPFFFPDCYGIIDEEKPTHAGYSQKQLLLQAAGSSLSDPSITLNASNVSHPLMKGTLFQMKNLILHQKLSLFSRDVFCTIHCIYI